MSRKSLKNIVRLINAETQEMPVEQSFLADLKRSIEMTANNGSDKPSQTYKPSSMNCIRSMYYQVTGANIDVGDASYINIGICNSGSDIHVRIQKAVEDMKNNGIDCEYVDVAEFIKNRHIKNIKVIEKSGMETKLWNKSLNMHFMCDGLIRYKGVYYILELKTETVRKWQTRSAVNPDHYNQGISYALSLGIDDVLFVYISRDNLDMKSFMFHVTDEMKEALVGRISECDNYVSKKVAPPKPEDAKCMYCIYQTVCGKDG